MATEKSVWWISDNSPEPNGHVKLIYLSAKKIPALFYTIDCGRSKEL